MKCRDCDLLLQTTIPTRWWTIYKCARCGLWTMKHTQNTRTIYLKEVYSNESP